MWVSTSKKLTNQPDFVRFVDQFGMDSAHRLFRRHVKKLKDEYLAKRVQGFMEMLPDVLQEMIPDLNTLQDRWRDILIRGYLQFFVYISVTVS